MHIKVAWTGAQLGTSPKKICLQAIALLRSRSCTGEWPHYFLDTPTATAPPHHHDQVSHLQLKGGYLATSTYWTPSPPTEDRWVGKSYSDCYHRHWIDRAALLWKRGLALTLYNTQVIVSKPTPSK